MNKDAVQNERQPRNTATLRPENLAALDSERILREAVGAFGYELQIWKFLAFFDKFCNIFYLKRFLKNSRIPFDTLGITTTNSIPTHHLLNKGFHYSPFPQLNDIVAKGNSFYNNINFGPSMQRNMYFQFGPNSIILILVNPIELEIVWPDFVGKALVLVNPTELEIVEPLIIIIIIIIIMFCYSPKHCFRLFEGQQSARIPESG